MTDEELHVLCLSYGEWCRTRRLLTPPVPVNILARFQPRKYRCAEPDAPMDAKLAYFNMAVHALAEESPAMSSCFAAYYIHGLRPVKAVAAELGISTRTFYDRVAKYAHKAWRLSLSIRRAHETVGRQE